MNLGGGYQLIYWCSLASSQKAIKRFNEEHSYHCHHGDVHVVSLPGN